MKNKFDWFLWVVLTTSIFVAFASSGCATMSKNPRNAHYYCVLDLTDKGVNPVDSNDICVDVFRRSHD